MWRAASGDLEKRQALELGRVSENPVHQNGNFAAQCDDIPASTA